MNNIRLRVILVSLFAFFSAFVVYKLVGYFEDRDGKYNHDIIRQALKPRDSDIIFGSLDAGESIYMYGNYRCIHCVHFFNEVLPDIEKKIFSEGKINLRFRVIPLIKNKKSIDAYSAAISVSKYGEYDKFHQMLLFNFNLVYSKNYEDLLNYILEHNEAIAQDYMSGNNILEIHRNIEEFKKCGFTGTPVFIFRNNIFKGEISIKRIESILNS